MLNLMNGVDLEKKILYGYNLIKKINDSVKTYSFYLFKFLQSYIVL